MLGSLIIEEVIEWESERWHLCGSVGWENEKEMGLEIETHRGMKVVKGWERERDA